MLLAPKYLLKLKFNARVLIQLRKLRHAPDVSNIPPQATLSILICPIPIDWTLAVRLAAAASFLPIMGNAQAHTSVAQVSSNGCSRIAIGCRSIKLVNFQLDFVSFQCYDLRPEGQIS